MISDVLCPNCSRPMAANLVACWGCYRATDRLQTPTDARITARTWTTLVAAWESAREMRMLRGVA